MLQCLAVCCSEVQSLDAVHISLLPRADSPGVWCSEGQYVALCHSALQCAAVIGQSTNVAVTSCRFIWSVVQYVAVCCSEVQHVAVRCSVLQSSDRVHMSPLHRADLPGVVCSEVQYVAVSCSRRYLVQIHLECSAVGCSTLLCVVVCGSVLQSSDRVHHVATTSSILVWSEVQCGAVHCSVLQCVAVCCSHQTENTMSLLLVQIYMECVAMGCCMLQCLAEC